MTPQDRSGRAEEQSVGSMVMAADVMQPVKYEKLWKEACDEMMEEEAFWTLPTLKNKDFMKIETKIEDKVYQHRSDIAQGRSSWERQGWSINWSRL